MAPRGLGRVRHWDVRNEQYMLKSGLMGRAMFAVARTLRLSRPRSWRQWLYFDQGQNPACTAYGSATFLAAAPTHPPAEWMHALDIMKWYADNVAFDQAHGRHYDGGASTLAAMEVGKARGYWTRYEWADSFETLRTWIHETAPLIVGTNWYDSMWTRDHEGICRITPSATIAGGHLYTLGAYDPKRDLYTYRSTWGDGDYKIPGSDMERLFREDGEAVFPYEAAPY